MEYSGYLFVHFTGESETGEQIYFSLSRDGLHWTDLNGGEPVIWSKAGEKGVRDPFILRNKIDGKFYIISTDLRIANGKGWEAAQLHGSRNIMVCSSHDLVNWTAVEPVEIGIDGAGCVWAPEAIYDESKREYMVFWASMVKRQGDENPKQRIYKAFTKDFKIYTEPQLYIERENHIIDTTIIEYKGIYYRFSKDETTKNIIADMSKNVSEGPFEKLNAPEVEKLMGVEGPACFKFNDREEWCLMVDRFAEGKGYMPIITKDISSGRFKVLEGSMYDMGKTKKRHGSVLNITGEEYEALEKSFGIN